MNKQEQKLIDRSLAIVTIAPDQAARGLAALTRSTLNNKTRSALFELIHVNNLEQYLSWTGTSWIPKH
jgi:hypothetical protein